MEGLAVLIHNIISHRYVHSSIVSRNVDMKWKVALSPGGVLSGNSGKQNDTQECISAILKLPVSFRILYGLKNTKKNIKVFFLYP